MRFELDGMPVFIGQGGAEWSADRATLVLLHGAGMDRTVWVLLARYLARHGFDIIAPDFPAHGGSGGSALESVETLAEWSVRLLDALASSHGIAAGEVVLAGHSLGSLVALEAAALRVRRGAGPAAVSESSDRLLLLGTGYPMAVGDALLGAAHAGRREAIDMIAIFGHGYASRLGHNSVPGVSTSNLARALLARAAPGVLHADLQACHRYAGAEAAAEVLSGTRVNIIAGDEDRMTPMAATRRLAELLGAEVDLIAGSGHMMMGEQPELVLQAMRRALAQASQG